MNEKMRGHIFIILLSSAFGVVAGMDRDKAMRQLVCKEIIPVLALNNYVVNASNAYQALKKEASLAGDSLETIKYNLRRKIKETNGSDRSWFKLIDRPVYPLNVSIIRSKLLHRARNFCSRHINIVYDNSLKAPDLLAAHIEICTYAYSVSSSGWESNLYSVNERHIGNVGFLHKKEFDSLPKQGKSLMIELSSEGNFSDWIKVTNRFRPVESGPSVPPVELVTPVTTLWPADDNIFYAQNLYDNSIRKTLMEIPIVPPAPLPALRLVDDSLFHERDLDYNPIDIQGLKMSAYSLFAGTILAAGIFINGLFSTP